MDSELSVQALGLATNLTLRDTSLYCGCADPVMTEGEAAVGQCDSACNTVYRFSDDSSEVFPFDRVTARAMLLLTIKSPSTKCNDNSKVSA